MDKSGRLRILYLIILMYVLLIHLHLQWFFLFFDLTLSPFILFFPATFQSSNFVAFSWFHKTIKSHWLRKVSFILFEWGVLIFWFLPDVMNNFFWKYLFCGLVLVLGSIKSRTFTSSLKYLWLFQLLRWISFGNDIFLLDRFVFPAMCWFFFESVETQSNHGHQLFIILFHFQF